ncbi:MAG: DUF2568 domain-containing protein [Ilumatobacter sp.]|uniref:DUF2568 domain-containing protein n=1 Tax=Ilumatobacter sp. TaxID=1967498 RepID=UPI00261184B6|nr:DUF2568 domain-containing protein [Ilumatobacter sp.]MDJ0767933.1 DUF2568 domain-containing protein [Ilumatobacter sp.]
MTAPALAGWNLALRFGLELAALAGLAVVAWRFGAGPVRWIAVVAVPLLAAAAWGVFNVAGDPSRSGQAPVEVAGWLRLTIELLILGGGAVALAVAFRVDVGIAVGLLVMLQYATSWSRVDWLLGT